MTPLHPDFLTVPLAHRGLHDGPARPENSMGAVQAAMQGGYGIEIDVQLSEDGRAMVFHDDTLDRLTDASGPTRNVSADQLCRLTLANGTQTIPTLRDILKEVNGRVPLLIEIKDQDHELGPNVGLLERAVAADLNGYAGPVAVMSFNPYSSLAMAELAPDVPRGLTTCDFTPNEWPGISKSHLQTLAEIALPDALGASFVSHDCRDLDRPRIAELKGAGIAILTWTIRSIQEEQNARHIADNITFEGYLADHSPR